MNAILFSLDSAKFANACATFSKADGYITKTIADAHMAGRSALCDVVSALALCKVPFSAALANTIRVTAFRARKAYNSEFTITVSSQNKTFTFDVAKTSDIQRKPGAGRKPAKSPAQGTTDATTDARIAAARSDAERYADALRALGFTRADLSNIAAGTMPQQTMIARARAHLSPKLPAARKSAKPAAQAA